MNNTYFSALLDLDIPEDTRATEIAQPFFNNWKDAYVGLAQRKGLIETLHIVAHPMTFVGIARCYPDAPDWVAPQDEE